MAIERLDIERLRTDPAYRAERSALRNGKRKPIETPEPIVQPQPIINAHMSPADREHWDMMNSWFLRSFQASFERHFDAHFKANIEPVAKTLAEMIGKNHVDTLLVTALLSSVIGINRNGMRPDITSLDVVQGGLDVLKEELGLVTETLITFTEADDSDEDEVTNDAS